MAIDAHNRIARAAALGSSLGREDRACPARAMFKMPEELTAIDRYRAQWQPNLVRIAELDMAFSYARLSGDIAAMREIRILLLEAKRPPRHLPIKNLAVTPEFNEA